MRMQMQITGKTKVPARPICFGTASLDSIALRIIQKPSAVNYKTFGRIQTNEFQFQPISEAAVSSLVAQSYDSNHHLPNKQQ